MNIKNLVLGEAANVSEYLDGGRWRLIGKSRGQIPTACNLRHLHRDLSRHELGRNRLYCHLYF